MSRNSDIATGIPIRPTGTLIRNSQRQPTDDTTRPPSTGPIAGAAITAIPKYPSARPRSAGSNNSKIIAIATGISSPPPTPCSTRAPTSIGRVGAIEQSIDASVNSTNAVMKARRRPKRSPTQPLVSWVTPTAMR